MSSALAVAGSNFHQTNVSLEEIDGLRDFVEKFERIELPSQMVAALNDPLLQKYTVLRDQKGHQRRIDDWLSLFFDAQLQAMADGEHHLKDLQEVLSGVLSYTRYTKVSQVIRRTSVHG